MGMRPHVRIETSRYDRQQQIKISQRIRYSNFILYGTILTAN